MHVLAPGPTTVGTPSRRTVAAAVLVALLLVACGGAGTPDGAGTAAGTEGAAGTEPAGADGSAALLGVIEPGVDVADEPADPAAAAFRTGEDGEGLVVGDLVRTDDAGFAEVAWFDGALARVDAATLYALAELDATPGEAVVVTELEVGRIWNRLRTDVAETYEVRTDVGTAAVRGTAFWVRCDDGGCTFAVLEGTVAVTTTDGTVVLEAGQQVTVDEDGVAGEVEPTDFDDAWVVRNAELDEAAGFGAIEPSDEGVAAAGDTTCPWAGMPDGWLVEPDPEAVGEASQFCRLVVTEDAAEAGVWTDLTWIGADGPELRGEVERARGIHDEVLEEKTTDPSFRCEDRDPSSYFVEHGEELASGELFGFRWRVMDSCGNLNGNSLHGIIADGQAYKLHLSPRAWAACFGEDGEVTESEHEAYTDCVFGLDETYGHQYGDLAAVLLGSG